MQLCVAIQDKNATNQVSILEAQSFSVKISK